MSQLPLFFTHSLVSDQVLLTGDDARHCFRVLRLREGDEIRMTDGYGNAGTAKILDTNIDRCVAIITRRDEIQNRSLNIHIGISPLKNVDRFEWFIEKATELGVSKITPILTARTEKTAIKTERLEKIIISGLKQSGQYWKPTLSAPVSFDKYLDEHTECQRFIAYCEDKPPLHLANSCLKVKDVSLLIGPEGDFTMNEVEKALSKNYTMVSLGENRLRTETAGIVAVEIVHIINSIV